MFTTSFIGKCEHFRKINNRLVGWFGFFVTLHLDYMHDYARDTLSHASFLCIGAGKDLVV